MINHDSYYCLPLMSHLNNSDSLFQRIIADVLSDVAFSGIFSDIWQERPQDFG